MRVILDSNVLLVSLPKTSKYRIVFELLLIRPNTEKYEIYYNWRLIVKDYDDNKFVDLAIASNSDYIVTNDSHFKVLNKTDFPKVKTIKLDDFVDLLRKQK